MGSPNKAVGPVRIDSRKFLGTLNDSAQAKVALFEERIDQMGRTAGKNWRLAALHAKSLYIEDTNTHEYFVADHSRETHGKVAITNIRPLEIIEAEKRGLFSETCEKLVSAIEENDQKSMQASFDRMKAQRFSGRAVPCSGMVKCRDGVLRQVNVLPNGVSLEEDTRAKLISVIVESLRDNVIIENGAVVSGNFSDGEPVQLPVTKWASRKLVARRMLESAKNAYWSSGFQDRVYSIAKLVSEGKIEDAVKFVSPFLNEMEEFTLLNYNQTKTLVENSLAAKAIFNQQICSDTATLFYRTNMKLSRGKIIDEWRSIAKKSEHPVLAENVKILEESKNFENSYQKFLELIFEAISNREVAAEALATTLDILRDKTPKIRESHDLSSKLNNLITRLKDKNFDDAAIYEAEDLIATIQEELAAADTLQNFDQMPPSGGSDDLGLDLGGAADGSGAPVININSPLIQIGGKSAAGGDESEAELPPMDEPIEEPPAEEGGDEELDALLGGGQTKPAAPAAPATPVTGAPTAPPMEGRKSRRALSESRPVHYEMKDEDDDDMPCDDDEENVSESYDPYAIRKSEKVRLSEGLHITEYGAPVISDSDDIHRIIHIMHRLANENKLSGNLLEKNLPSMAKASIKALGLRIPEGKMNHALEQVISTFIESSDKPFPGATAPFGKSDKKSKTSASKKPWESEEDCDDTEDCEEGVAEDQYHSPYIPKRGLSRASIKQTACESISWGESQADAMLGEYAGVRFIFDHGGSNDNLKPVVLSEDGSVEIPIPTELYDSAFAAANMAEGDGEEFVNWISESIEQLRPITDPEDTALNEAMAKITTGPDGSISVEVEGDVDVVDAEDEEGDASIGGIDMGVDMGVDMGDDEGDEAGMAPVDSVDMTIVDTDSKESDEEGEMPDFEESESMEDESEEEESEEEDSEEEESEEGFAEDKDITTPTNSKYTKHVKDDPRDMPSVKIPKDTSDELEGIGPDVKKDDGTGTKSPTARKGS